MDNSPTVSIELMEKNRPQQQRAIQTYERILESAAQLLQEVGVERISTNLIAERAGVTVPALYRYFANKYAVFYALGARLMDRQNEAMLTWQQSYEQSDDPFIYLNHIEELLHLTLQATREQTAGLAILRMLRVIPALQDIRLKSHSAMASWAAGIWGELFSIEVTEQLLRGLRLTMELGTSAVEMSMEDPDMPPDFAFSEYGAMVRGHWQGIIADQRRNI